MPLWHQPWTPLRSCYNALNFLPRFNGSLDFKSLYLPYNSHCICCHLILSQSNGNYTQPSLSHLLNIMKQRPSKLQHVVNAACLRTSRLICHCLQNPYDRYKNGSHECFMVCCLYGLGSLVTTGRAGRWCVSEACRNTESNFLSRTHHLFCWACHCERHNWLRTERSSERMNVVTWIPERRCSYLWRKTKRKHR